MSRTIVPRRGLALLASAAALLSTASAASANVGYVPTGRLDNVYQGVLYYSTDVPMVTGWAADADAPHTPIAVRGDVSWTRRVCRSGAGCINLVIAQRSLTVPASGYRTDLLGVAGPGDVLWGPSHGFTMYLPVIAAGSYTSETLCVTALNVGGGSNRSLGCYPVVFQPLY